MRMPYRKVTKQLVAFSQGLAQCIASLGCMQHRILQTCTQSCMHVPRLSSSLVPTLPSLSTPVFASLAEVAVRKTATQNLERRDWSGHGSLEIYMTTWLGRYGLFESLVPRAAAPTLHTCAEVVTRARG